jgi:hypothetical protein
LSKSYNPRRAKLHRSYTCAEAAAIFGVTRAAVRAWIKAGLPAIKTSGPVLILGSDLQTFLAQRQAVRRRTCPPGTIYCLKCREPQEPDPDTLTIVRLKPTSGNLRGHCLTCGSGMNRRVTLAKLAEAGFGQARPTPEEPNLSDSPNPSLKHHRIRTPQL